ncbi:ABC transporter six-transmembrane domain-containing protein [Gordonia phthalatica]|uniref:ABC transmembrane type-1 domain-containing protein n=1 Tax=Gordonia phthalatica TaxID=1136941 RepID=A0A0N9N9B6_9ACTN|nr:ABC transporter six-transmembrane domain-containing protein [Gordonia phthalatica]ALG83785.1 hypothetical protein ACH46_03755 [Gordonia phthalatica]
MWSTFGGHRALIGTSVLMMAAEAVGAVFAPFLIGLAIDDYLDGSYRGLITLGIVGLATAALATVRRLLDVRRYARIYEQLSADSYSADADLSTKSARLNMLREALDFVEHGLPMIVAAVGAFIGTLVFLAALSFPIFLAALAMAVVILLVYAMSTRRTLRLNRKLNDEFEHQVEVLQLDDRPKIRKHISMLNVWQIKLSDLDASNLAVALVLTVVLQIFAAIVAAKAGMDDGARLAVMLYVFEFAAVSEMLPEAWQEYLGARDIVRRLEGLPAEA